MKVNWTDVSSLSIVVGLFALRTLIVVAIAYGAFALYESRTHDCPPPCEDAGMLAVRDCAGCCDERVRGPRGGGDG